MIRVIGGTFGFFGEIDRTRDRWKVISGSTVSISDTRVYWTLVKLLATFRKSLSETCMLWS